MGSRHRFHEHLRAHPESPGRSLCRPQGLAQSGQIAMQPAGMARLEKSLSLCNAAVHQHLSKSRARLIQPFYLSSYCLC